MATTNRNGVNAAVVPDIATAVDGVLAQLDDLLSELTDADYTSPPARVKSGSVGEHIRHNLDHIRALLDGLVRGSVDYDARERGTDIECSRDAARQEIARLRKQLADASPRPDCAVRVRSTIRSDGQTADTSSTFGRELLFVFSHTVHHNAMIALLVAYRGIEVPARFGYAPATLHHLQRSATCAR